MDRGAWQATVHGVARVGHNLATKPPPLPIRGLHLNPSSTELPITKSSQMAQLVKNPPAMQETHLDTSSCQETHLDPSSIPR